MPVMNSWRLPAIILTFVTLVFIAALPVAALDLTMNSYQSSIPSISKGDSVHVHGIATGQPAGGLRIWLISNNYARIDSVTVNSDDSYTYDLKTAETQNLASGQYFVLVQHPMMNAEFDVNYNTDTGEVIRRTDNRVLFRLTGSGRLQASDAAHALVSDISSQNIDDSFSAVSFFIAPPATSIDVIGDRHVGDKFSITGSTNLAAGDALEITIVSSSFIPTTKQQSGEFSGATGTVSVVRGTGMNRWSFPVDTSTWKPDEYIVTVSAIIQEASASTTFILEESPIPSPTLATTPPTTVATPATTMTTLLATTTTAPAGIITVLAACLVVFLIIVGNRGKL